MASEMCYVFVFHFDLDPDHTFVEGSLLMSVCFSMSAKLMLLHATQMLNHTGVGAVGGHSVHVSRVLDRWLCKEY